MDDIRKYSVMDGFFGASLADADPELAAAIGHELVRQQDQIEMIASENIVSNAVLEAQGSVLTNKYAEGYSGRRYYGGASLSMSPKHSPSIAPRSFLVPHSSMCSRIPVPRQSGGVPVAAEAG